MQVKLTSVELEQEDCLILFPFIPLRPFLVFFFFLFFLVLFLVFPFFFLLLNLFLLLFLFLFFNFLDLRPARFLLLFFFFFSLTFLLSLRTFPSGSIHLLRLIPVSPTLNSVFSSAVTPPC